MQEFSNDPDAKETRSRRERKTDDKDKDTVDSKFQVEEVQVANEPPKPGRRRRNEEGNGGGWMSSVSGGGDKNLGSRISTVEEDDPKEAQIPNQNNKEKYFQEDKEEIMIIPDLEEDGVDADQRIAHAPRNINRKIPTLAELESDVKSAVPSAEGGLNLSILLSTLVPATLVQETDTLWTFDNLLREISDELSNTPKTILTVSSMNPSVGNNIMPVSTSNTNTINPNTNRGSGSGSNNPNTGYNKGSFTSQTPQPSGNAAGGKGFKEPKKQ